MSVGVRRPSVSLRYHRGPVTALEAQQPFGCTTISTRCEFLSFTSSNDRPGNNTAWMNLHSRHAISRVYRDAQHRKKSIFY